jgi:hypothetical protein
MSKAFLEDLHEAVEEYIEIWQDYQDHHEAAPSCESYNAWALWERMTSWAGLLAWLSFLEQVQHFAARTRGGAG